MNISAHSGRNLSHSEVIKNASLTKIRTYTVPQHLDTQESECDQENSFSRHMNQGVSRSSQRMNDNTVGSSQEFNRDAARFNKKEIQDATRFNNE